MDNQNEFKFVSSQSEMRNRDQILRSVEILINSYNQGKLGGDVMPEDSNPKLCKDSKENHHFFTLPMALNYQRNSYTLWEAATKTYIDESTREVFDPTAVASMTVQLLREKLLKHKLALQPNKHIDTWNRICESLNRYYTGDIRNLFIESEADIPEIKKAIQIKYKKGFPYLSGPKIFNYWLYVMGNYTDANFKHKEELSIAPDTHVIQASLKLGLIDRNTFDKSGVADVVDKRWRDLLSGTNIAPIDIHTPLWLWSRGGFHYMDQVIGLK